MTWAYYNDSEPFVCDWLENLIRERLLPAGEIDRRPIQEVTPDDVRGFTQCHFFAGIGGWAYALRLAGWPDDRPVWTGSCPCPPFSSAGKKKPCPSCGGAKPVPCPRRTGYFICCICGHAWFADARHLWPELWRLVAECRPRALFGEQVASSDGRVWLAAVRASLEILDYAVGATDLPASGVGAPHLRQRLWFVAESESARGRADAGAVRARAPAGLREAQGQDERRAIIETGGAVHRGSNGFVADGDGSRCGAGRSSEAGDGRDAPRVEPSGLRIARVVDDSAGARRDGAGQGPEGEARDEARLCGPERGRATRVLADAVSAGRPEGRARTGGGSVASGGGTGELAHADGGQPGDGDLQRSGEQGLGATSFWDAADWLPCRDGKARPVEPDTFPLAHGVPARVGRLRAYGNAINPYTAAAFVKAYMECMPFQAGGAVSVEIAARRLDQGMLDLGAA